MRFPLQITFRNMSHSNEVEESIRAEAEKLETFYDRITACRVAVEVPHRHHRKGKPVHVRIDLNLPGREIVVKREPVVSRRSPMSASARPARQKVKKSAHGDLLRAIHDAFKAAGRRVQDFARQRRGDVKVHEALAARG